MPPKPRHWLRFTLRTLLIAVTMLALSLGWRVNRANRQREVVRLIQNSGGSVKYDFEYEPGGATPNDASWAPRWALDLAGVDFVHHVVYVELGQRPPKGAPRQARDAIAGLPKLSRIRCLMLYGEKANDRSLAHVARLSRLEESREQPDLEGRPGRVCETFVGAGRRQPIRFLMPSKRQHDLQHEQQHHNHLQ
jgi:hypothetical protein